MERQDRINNGILPGLGATPLVHIPESLFRSSSTSNSGAGGMTSYLTLVTNSDGLTIAKCDLCPPDPPKTTSVRGFSNHLKHAHLSVYNSLIDTIRSRARWSEEEEWLLAYLEFDMYGTEFEYSRVICQALAENLGYRTMESIRARRTGLSYKMKLQYLVERHVSHTNPTIAGESSDTSEDEEDPRLPLMVHLHNVVDEIAN